MYKYQQTTQTKSSTVSKIYIWAFKDQITDRSYTRCHCNIAVYRRSWSNHKHAFPVWHLQEKFLKSIGICSIFTKRFKWSVYKFEKTGNFCINLV